MGCAYIQAENQYTHKVTEHQSTLRDDIFDELLRRIKEDDTSVPIEEDGWWYYTRTESGKAYSIHCRKKGSLNAQEEILLDENVLAQSHDYFSLGSLAISEDHNLMAYSIDTNGREKYTVYIKNIRQNIMLPDRLPETDGAILWANDHQTIFYTTMDESLRSNKVFRHQLGSSSTDQLVFEEKDQNRTVKRC